LVNLIIIVAVASPASSSASLDFFILAMIRLKVNFL
jgi:hypothetical protein